MSTTLYPSKIITQYSGFKLQQTLTSSGSVTIPSGITTVFAIVIGAGGNLYAGGLSYGFVPASSTVTVGTGSTTTGGSSSYSTLFAAGGGAVLWGSSAGMTSSSVSLAAFSQNNSNGCQLAPGAFYGGMVNLTPATPTGVIGFSVVAGTGLVTSVGPGSGLIGSGGQCLPGSGNAYAGGSGVFAGGSGATYSTTTAAGGGGGGYLGAGGNGAATSTTSTGGNGGSGGGGGGKALGGSTVTQGTGGNGAVLLYY